MKLTPWSVVKAKLMAHMTDDEKARYEAALDRARQRYVSEIRKHRGINRIRAMYRRRKR